MHGLELFEEDDSDTVFRDVIMLALCGFIAIVLLLLPHLNPPAKAADEEVSAPGNVLVEIFWPDGLNSDVDLWVEAPGDVPVGYSNMGGAIFNLLRDDLGTVNDVTELNYEVAYSRGVVEGEHTVNVHLYRNEDGVAEIPVTVVVSVKRSVEERARQLLTTDVTLEHGGQELTAFRFRLNAAGELVNGSVHSLFKPLRTAQG